MNKVPFYTLKVNSYFFYLGQKYLKVPLTQEEEKSFNAINCATKEKIYLWGQAVIPET